MERVTCIAVDWSGSEGEEAQLAHIWLAVAESDSLIRLKEWPYTGRGDCHAGERD